MNTLFRKELKDVLRWSPLGMLVIGVLCWQSIPGRLHECHSVSTSIAGSVVIGSSVFALALGLLQSFFDLRTDSRAFLLHRPIETRSIFWGKLAAGFIAHCVAWSVPLLLTAVYLEWTGPQRLPVSWFNVVFAAICCVISFSFHPAGIWMACREARWVGTKCLPLVLPLIATATVTTIGSTSGQSWALMIPVVLIAVLTWVIIAASKHAFTHQTFLPSSQSAESWSWSGSIGLAVSSMAVAITIMGFVATAIMTRQYSMPLQARRLATSDAGQVWEVEETWKSPRQWNDQPIRQTGRPLTGDNTSDSFVELKDNWTEQPLLSVADSYRNPFAKSFFNSYQYLSAAVSDRNYVYLYQRDGQILLYEDFHEWLGTVTPNGLFRPHETPQGAFNIVTALDDYHDLRNDAKSLSGRLLLADQNGIYQLDIDAWEIRRLSDVPVTKMVIKLPSDSDPSASLWSQGNGILSRFAINPRMKGQSLASTDSELVKATSTYPLAAIEITPMGQWPLDWIDQPDKTTLSVSSFAEDHAVFITQDPMLQRNYRIANADGSFGESGELPPLEVQQSSPGFLEALIPPGAIAVGMIVLSIVDPNSLVAMHAPSWVWIKVLLHALLGGAGALMLARSRVRSVPTQIVWAVIGLLAGIPTWLAVVAIHARPYFEQCTGCQRDRRIDTDHCEHCNAAWDIPESEGIELIGPRGFLPTTTEHEPMPG